MNAMTLHPVAATAIPYTICATGQSGKRAKAAKRPRDLTCADLRQLVAARGLRATTAHTKSELRAMLTSGQQLRPAAYDRNNAARRLARAAAKKSA